MPYGCLTTQVWESEMNLQNQFRMEDIRKKNEQANKKKSSADVLIIVGNILLFISAVVSLVIAIFTDYFPGRTGSSDLSYILDCCFGFGISSFGLVGIIFLLFGVYSRYNANQELYVAEEESRRLILQMVGEEEKKDK
jgi:hypothetical protein